MLTLRTELAALAAVHGQQETPFYRDIVKQLDWREQQATPEDDRQVLYDACGALIGLIQLVCVRDDMPVAIKNALLCSHRMTEGLEARSRFEAKA